MRYTIKDKILHGIQPGRVTAKRLMQLACFPVSEVIANSGTHGASANNGALLYSPVGEYSCVLRSCRRDCCHGIVPGGLSCFAPFKGLCPLRRSASIPATPQSYFLPAGHAKHGAAPQGVFDWMRGRSVQGIGSAPTRASENPKGYFDALLAYGSTLGEIVPDNN